MTTYVALLRAVNVGGTGKLPMERLRAMCGEAGLRGARTYIASGNVVFEADMSEDDVRRRLEAALAAYAGRPVGIVVRSAAEIADTLAGNPFTDQPGNRVLALFTNDPLPADALAGATGLRDEQVRLGRRVLYVHYPRGQADTRLRLPAMTSGTGRNINTVAKLAEMAVTAG